LTRRGARSTGADRAGVTAGTTSAADVKPRRADAVAAGTTRSTSASVSTGTTGTTG
jgi:hypothetical protein